MMTVTSLRLSADEMTCNKCGHGLIAPEWSYDFSEEGLVINLWSCMNCGNPARGGLSVCSALVANGT